MFETSLHRWLVYWHGRGEAHQHDYYRCEGCHRIVSWKAIEKGGCSCDLGNKLHEARLKWHEKVRLILCPWSAVR